VQIANNLKHFNHKEIIPQIADVFNTQKLRFLKLTKALTNNFLLRETNMIGCDHRTCLVALNLFVDATESRCFKRGTSS
jgi:hypothetical protein